MNKTFIKFVIDSDNKPVRLSNIPFAAFVVIVILSVLFFVALGLGWLFLDNSKADFPHYLVLGLSLLGVLNGLSSIIGLFTLALRAPLLKNEKDND